MDNETNPRQFRKILLLFIPGILILPTVYLTMKLMYMDGNFMVYSILLTAMITGMMCSFYFYIKPVE